MIPRNNAMNLERGNNDKNNKRAAIPQTIRRKMTDSRDIRQNVDVEGRPRPENKTGESDVEHER